MRRFFVLGKILADAALILGTLMLIQINKRLRRRETVRIYRATNTYPIRSPAERQ